MPMNNPSAVSGAGLSANSFTGTQTITPPVGSSALVVASTVQTTSQPVLDLAQTWNAAGVTFTGWKLNVTDTASAAASMLADWQVGGTSVAAVPKTGGLLIPTVTSSDSSAVPGLRFGTAGALHSQLRVNSSLASFDFAINGTYARVRIASDQIGIGSDNSLVWYSSANGVTYGSKDTALARNAAGIVEVNNGTAGTLRDLKLRSAIQSPPASVTPSVNGELVFEATSNTTLTVKLKGTDGTVRTATLTLA